MSDREKDSGFKPYYKWIIFNIKESDDFKTCIEKF